ncbi:SIS domain-containing protein [Holdemania massiliensis]|uniref:SIS domain-containing protein n=1 Tax=Holdemania massiliensis TaxID=1468449 RepID=UPI001F05B97E|nr:SIS domain-containing protein [Holdemania massiliensis]MCH1941936.1 SIS domain-containing protein [Holdemania massiliensis]
MSTLLETIQSTPIVLQKLIDNRAMNNQAAIECIQKNLPDFKEIILIGSGSSLNEAKTARGFVEKVTGRRTVAETSNDFLHNHTVFDTKNLYIFMSQSGTSQTTREAQLSLKKKGCVTIAISSETEKFLAAESMAYVNSMAKDEEYLCVTMGFSASLIALELLGLSIGEYLNTICAEQVMDYIADLKKAMNNYGEIIPRVETWFAQNGKVLMNADLFAVYGSDSLWGVALEGALKILEIPKLYAVGYELEDGMHGPTLSFNDRICLLILNDGGRENERAKALARFVKTEFHQGFLIGQAGLDDTDLIFETASDHFKNLEFACAVQTICWFMAVENGTDLTHGKGVGSSGKRYFSTHSDAKLS